MVQTISDQAALAALVNIDKPSPARMPALAREASQLSGPLRQRINQMAHRASQAYELRFKDDLTARLQAARGAGAGFSELSAILDRAERSESAFNKQTT